MNELSCVNIMRGDIVTTSRFDGNFFHLEILTQTLRYVLARVGGWGCCYNKIIQAVSSCWC